MLMKELKNMHAKTGGQNQTKHKSKYVFAILWFTKVIGFYTSAEWKNTDNPDEWWSEGQFYI
jgi:hypothetical protein